MPKQFIDRSIDAIVTVSIGIARKLLGARASGPKQLEQRPLFKVVRVGMQTGGT